MDKEIEEYHRYLLSFGVINKPKMPKFDLTAYTDSEYLNALYESVNQFEIYDDESITVNYLKGD